MAINVVYIITVGLSPTLCMVTHIASVWIDRVRLPIPHVVSWTGKMNFFLSAFAPENLVSRDGFGSPVPRQPAHLHTLAESGAHSPHSRLNVVLTYGIPPHTVLLVRRAIHFYDYCCCCMSYYWLTMLSLYMCCVCVCVYLLNCTWPRNPALSS